MLQELGIPFQLAGACDPTPECLDMVAANFEPQHMHRTIEEQNAGRPCLKHPKARSCQMAGADLLVMGPPCPPFSQQRSKRLREGTVKNHPAFNVTWNCAFSAITSKKHRAVIMEQVVGFDMPEKGEDETPMCRPADVCSTSLLVCARSGGKA